MYRLTVILLLTTSITASPAPQAPPPEDSNITHLYTCTDASFKGTCNNLHLAVSTCHALGDDLKDKVSSAGPDEGTFCTMYTKPDCTGLALPFTYPGIRAFARYGFNDVVESVRCDFIAGWKSHP